MNYEVTEKSKFKFILMDFFTSFKISLIVSLVVIILGAIIGLIYCLATGTPITVLEIFQFIFRVGIWVSCFGFAIVAIAFAKPDKMRDLNYQNQWRKYYKFFNLIGAMAMICFFVLAYSLILDGILWKISGL